MTADANVREIKARIETAKFVCFFGIGVLLQDCFEQVVLSVGREPDFLCDNAPQKWGSELFGKRCVSPSEIKEWCEETAVVITVKNYEPIHAQLRRMGVRDVFVACYDRCYNSIRDVKRLERDHPSADDRNLFHTSVRGKWALITGSSRGVGRQIAEAMARLGANIVAHSRSELHVRELVDACSSCGVRVVPVAAEMRNLNDVDGMLARLENMVPQVDIIFNNAAVSPAWPMGFWSSPSLDYLDTYTINTIAPIRICQHLIPPMVKRGSGRVITISTSIQRRPGEMAYACSKAALDKFVHDLAPTLHGTGVMLSSVDPGWLRTDMGGPGALHAVESVIPGALLGALLDADVNGRWFTAQDYAGLSIEDAIRKAMFVLSLQPNKSPAAEPERTAVEAP